MTSQYRVLHPASDLDCSTVRIKPWQSNTCNISYTNSFYGQIAVEQAQYREKQETRNKKQETRNKEHRADANPQNLYRPLIWSIGHQMRADINLPWAAAISEGMKQGIDRHWRYSKEMLKVKPEYLLTVFVAERLAWGAGEQSGYDLSIKLEESTHNIVGNIWFNQIGLKRYFREYFPWPGRRGRVDIYVEHKLTKEARIIELKNFDPSSTELSKELKRFVHFF